ncbi:MAG: extracellular solute-binding protein [Patescibacteria group bacterium]
MSKFQIVLLGVFGVFILTAVLVFALYRGGANSSQQTVEVWGDIPAAYIESFIYSTSLSQNKTISIKYFAKPSDELEAAFTEALAQGGGPDLIILSHDQYWKNRNKLIPIPYKSISERDFKNTFVEGGEVFLTTDGIYALPFSIDPMVLYYNRDLLSSAGISKPLTYWDEIYNQTLTLSKRDAAGNLTRSAISLGETKNISNYKDILSLLFLQAGTTITGSTGSGLRSLLLENFNLPTRPADSALDFYTQFSNPTKPYYSWNRTLSEAQTRFTSGDLAYYLGFASELPVIRSKSPTLNFSISPVPQSRVSGRITTFARVKGIAISRGSRNPAVAYEAALNLVSPESSQALSQIMGLSPTRRDLLAGTPTDSIFPVLYAGSLQSKVWLDPDPLETEKIFRDMVDTVTSGRARTSETVNKASGALDSLISK